MLHVTARSFAVVRSVGTAVSLTYFRRLMWPAAASDLRGGKPNLDQLSGSAGVRSERSNPAVVPHAAPPSCTPRGPAPASCLGAVEATSASGTLHEWGAAPAVHQEMPAIEWPPEPRAALGCIVSRQCVRLRVLPYGSPIIPSVIHSLFTVFVSNLLANVVAIRPRSS